MSKLKVLEKDVPAENPNNARPLTTLYQAEKDNAKLLSELK